jgi:hypothetical protein
MSNTAIRININHIFCGDFVTINMFGGWQVADVEVASVAADELVVINHREGVKYRLPTSDIAGLTNSGQEGEE